MTISSFQKSHYSIKCYADSDNNVMQFFHQQQLNKPHLNIMFIFTQG